MTETEDRTRERVKPRDGVTYEDAVVLLASWLRSANSPDRVSAAAHFVGRLWDQGPADVIRDALLVVRSSTR